MTSDQEVPVVERASTTIKESHRNAEAESRLAADLPASLQAALTGTLEDELRHLTPEQRAERVPVGTKWINPHFPQSHWLLTECRLVYMCDGVETASIYSLLDLERAISDGLAATRILPPASTPSSVPAAPMAAAAVTDSCKFPACDCTSSVGMCGHDEPEQAERQPCTNAAKIASFWAKSGDYRDHLVPRLDEPEQTERFDESTGPCNCGGCSCGLPLGEALKRSVELTKPRCFWCNGDHGSEDCPNRMSVDTAPCSDAASRAIAAVNEPDGWRKQCVVSRCKDGTFDVWYGKRWLRGNFGEWTKHDSSLNPGEHTTGYWPSEAAARDAILSAPLPPTVQPPRPYIASGENVYRGVRLIAARGSREAALRLAGQLNDAYAAGFEDGRAAR